MNENEEIDVPVFDDTPPDDEQKVWPGIDPDGKERRPIFAGRYAANDTSMADYGVIVSDTGDKRARNAGTVAPSPFPRA